VHAWQAQRPEFNHLKSQNAYQEGMKKSVAAIQNSMEGSSKIKNVITVLSSNSTSEDIPEITRNRISETYLPTHIHYSISHNSQEAEATQMPIDG
jgi:hypothetical protein